MSRKNRRSKKPADNYPAPGAVAAAAPPALASEVAPGGGEAVIRKLLRVVWLSIALGVGLEIVALIVSAFAGALPKFPVIVADTVQKGSWSLLVCGALAIGVTSAKALRAAASGVLGLFAAPLAFVIAKSLHKAVAQAMGADLPPPLTVAPSPLVLATIKAVEFGILGCAAAWLTRFAWADMRAYGLLGLGVAIVFGGAAVGYTVNVSNPAPATAKVVALGLNELLYPIGCALVLYASDAMSQRLGRGGEVKR